MWICVVRLLNDAEHERLKQLQYKITYFFLEKITSVLYEKGKYVNGLCGEPSMQRISQKS